MTIWNASTGAKATNAAVLGAAIAPPESARPVSSIAAGTPSTVMAYQRGATFQCHSLLPHARRPARPSTTAVTRNAAVIGPR